MRYNLIALACAILLAAGLSLTVTAGPTEPDTDGDTVVDIHDNCYLKANTNQYDQDQDGYGQACDADYSQDGKVDNTDFATFQANYLPLYLGVCDHTCDGKVDNSDYATFQTLFPPTGTINPGPSGQTCAGLAVGSCPGNPICP
jgi:hypothetical protein